jgi:alpha-tubulin suppressor-like RCC1 family protein
LFAWAHGTVVDQRALMFRTCVWMLVLGCGSTNSSPTGDAVVETDDDASDARVLDAVVDPPRRGRLAVGGYHSCLLDDDGMARCWGNNVAGQLGDGTTTARAVPTPVNGGPYAMLSLGSYYTCGVKPSGVAECWGRNTDGQLGDGTTTNRVTPTPVSMLGATTAVIAGGATTCALGGAGARCWGHNQFGQLGIGNTNHPQLAPGAGIVGLSTPSALAVGAEHTCGLTSEHAIRCWGYEYRGRLGNGNNNVNTVHSSPLAIDLLGLAVDQIDTGMTFTCARTQSGRVACTGENSSGQLGDGSQVPTAELTVIPNLTNVTLLATAAEAACAATGSSVVCWGRNRSGQIGNGSGGVGQVVLSPTPVLDLDPTDPIIELDAGFAHVCARGTSGRVWCWGDNTFGEIGDGTVNTDRFRATRVMQ